MNLKCLFNFILFFSFILIIHNSCRSISSTEAISTDTAVISKGKLHFEQYCGSCHNFRNNGIGPNLSGLTSSVPADWIHSFIKDPQQMIFAGDKRANALVEKYKTVMPSFASLKDQEIDALIAYMHTFKSDGVGNQKQKGLPDPIPEKISLSNLVIDLKEVATFPVTSEKKDTPLTRVTLLRHQPGNGRLFACDLRGQLYVLNDGKPEICMDFNVLRKNFIHQPGLATGLGSFAFHPEFNTNGLLYTAHTEKPGLVKPEFGYTDSLKHTVQWVVTEWKIKDPNAKKFSGDSRELFRADMVSGIHGMQEITFNPLAKKGDPDYGNLYIGIGDGGSVEEGHLHLVHSKERIWGTVIRIHPAGTNSRNGRYGIPPDNPFAKDSGDNTVKEIYAMGFRNPHRITWSGSGLMLVSNIGQKNIESLNLVESGQDFGWPFREGSFVLDAETDLDNIYPLPANDSKNHFTYPVAEYDHDEGVAISGGYEYTGSALPVLKGKFFFGDIPSGRLFYIDLNQAGKGQKAEIKEWEMTVNGERKRFTDICGKRVDLHFGRDAKGELYLFTKADGKMYKMAAVGKGETSNVKSEK